MKWNGGSALEREAQRTRIEPRADGAGSWRAYSPVRVRSRRAWQHSRQHPYRPMRPLRLRRRTHRTIWRGTDVSDARVTRLRAWSGITGWRFESSSAHRKALRGRAFRVVQVATSDSNSARGNTLGNIAGATTDEPRAAPHDRSYGARSSTWWPPTQEKADRSSRRRRSGGHRRSVFGRYLTPWLAATRAAMRRAEPKDRGRDGLIARAKPAAPDGAANLSAGRAPKPAEPAPDAGPE